MSALSTLIDTAIGTVIAEHPKLFDPQGTERARKVLTREIMKTLTREPKAEDGAEATPTEAPSPPFEFVPPDDPRARAYINLRAIAGAVAPMQASGNRISLPREADTAAIHAFADPPAKPWPFVTGPQLAAWLEFFAGVLPNVTRRKIVEKDDLNITGAFLPWPWPPSKTGKVYHPDENQDCTM